MHLGLRLLFAFLAIAGLAGFFLLRVFVTEIKPSVREVMEDVLVDTANLLAEVAAPELAALPAGGQFASSAGSGGPAAGGLARAVASYRERTVDVKIWGLRKLSLDLRVLVTDINGRVVFDSGQPTAVGQDYSRWRDVLLTLRGEYGARTTRDVGGSGAAAGAAGQPVMHVAAPVREPRAGGAVIGALVVAKPMSTIAPFIERAERKVLLAGVVLLGLSLAIGVWVTLWTVGAVRKLRAYALQVGLAAADPAAPRAPASPPTLPGELGELARAVDGMRARLEGREQLEQHVRALTHELKSPLAAIRGAAELLQDDLPPADRQRFVAQVGEQAERLRAIIEQMLELSKLESLRALPSTQPLDLAALTEATLAQHAAALQQRGLRWRWLERDAGVRVPGDHERLTLALSNVLANAVAFAPAQSWLDFSVCRAGPSAARWSLRDHGPGVPAYALPQLGERFFSTAAPSLGDSPAAPRGSGLGLAIVRQVVWLHGGSLRFEAAEPGLRVVLELPLVELPRGAAGMGL